MGFAEAPLSVLDDEAAAVEFVRDGRVETVRPVVPDSAKVDTIGVEVLLLRARALRSGRAEGGGSGGVELARVAEVAWRGDARDEVGLEESLSAVASRLSFSGADLELLRSRRMPPCGAVSPLVAESGPGSLVSMSLSPLLVVESFIVDLTSAVDFPVITATLCNSGVLIVKLVTPFVVFLPPVEEAARFSAFCAAVWRALEV